MRSLRLVAGLLATTVALSACKNDPPSPPEYGDPTLADTTLPETTVGVSYSATFSASDGKAPYTFSAQGLPPGITLASDSGALSGTASAAGDFQLQVTVKDSNSKQNSKSFPIKIHPAVSFEQNALPQATAEAPYSTTIELEGGKTPLTLRLTAGELPAGVNLDTRTRQLSGTFPSAGTLALTFEATDAHGAKATRSYTLTVAEALRITSTTLPAGNRGQVYSQVIATSGGRAPVTLSLESGALPPGVTLSGGVLSGTPSSGGSFPFVLKLTDANGASITASFTLDIYSQQPPRIATTTLPNGVVGKEYAEFIVGAEGAPPYTFTVSSGSLPAGLSLATGGLLSGTPTTAETQSFQVTLTDSRSQTASRGFTLSTHPALVVQTTTLAEGYQGQFYSQTLTASGGRTPYRWEAQGTLPPGLSLTTSGILSGTPPTAGSYGVTFNLTDASGQLTTGAFQLTIYTLPTFINASLADGSVGVAYNQRLRASGGKAPYTIALTGGVLPPGLQLTGDTLHGTPTTPSTSSLTFQVTDANGRSSTKDLDLRIFNGLAITTDAVDDAYVGRGYAKTLSAVGGDTSQPYTWAIIGSLPAGLSMSTSGVITGTATAAGTTRFTAEVKDRNNASATRVFDLRVLTAPSVTTSSLPEAFEDAAYSTTLAGADGLPPYQWQVSAGTLPAGLTLSSGGVISGTPTASGNASFTVELTDGNGMKATASLSLNVSALTIVSASPGDGYTGEPYTYTFTATGGPTPFTWNITGLPSGLSFDAGTGVVSGTPSAAGTFSLNVRVTDALSRVVTRSLSLTFYAPPQINTASLADGTANVAYLQPLEASNGKPPYSWSITAGTPHAGLSFSESAGIWALRGMATESDTRALTFQVADANGRTASRTLSLSILDELILNTTTLADAYEGRPYSQLLTASGGKPGYTFDRASGALPGGLSLSPSGQLSGTVASGATTSSFTARVTDANNTQATRSLSISVYEVPAITAAHVQDGYVSESYVATFAASGGKAPLTWSVASGALPAGVTLNPASGQLSGVPTSSGTFSFTLKVTDANGLEGSESLQTTIYTLPALTTASPLPGAYAGQPYTTTFSATGGKAPLVYNLSAGTLPDGLTLTPGGILGTEVSSAVPHATTSAFTLQVTDANGKLASRPFELTTWHPPTIPTASLPTATEGVTYRLSEALPARIEVQYGQGPLTYAATGLPQGLSLHASTGELTGIPAQGTEGSYSVTFTVTDAGSKTASKVLSLEVVKPRSIPVGGVVGLAPEGSRITDTLTVFTTAGRVPLAGVGVRVRKNGQEYNPIKQALTNAEGKVVFTGLGLNGTTDTVDITANGKDLVNATYARVNASLVTLRMNSSPLPGGRVSSSLAYDPASNRALIFGGQDALAGTSLFFPQCLNDVVEVVDIAQKSFTTRVPGGLTTAPSPRYQASTAVAGGSLVLFGGLGCVDTGDALGDTWELNLTTHTWTQANPTTRPLPRQGASMVREASGNSLIMVGGHRPRRENDEVWRYTPATDTWTSLGSAPMSSAWMGSTLHTGTGEMWFCGGIYSDECHSFNPTSQVWTPRPALPSARHDFSMAYDPFTQNLYAFGGRPPFGSRPVGDLLVLRPNATAWELVTPPGARPTARHGHVMYFDLTRRELVVALGNTVEPVTFLSRRLGDVWTYDGSVWTERGTPATTPVSYSLSGQILNGPASRLADIHLVTTSGFSTSVRISLDEEGQGTYTLSGIPPGEAAFVTVTGWEYSLDYPNDLWSYTDAELPPLVGNTTADFTLPTGPAVLLQTLGQYLLPASWRGKSENLGWSSTLDVPGFPHFSLANGGSNPEALDGRFDVAFPPPSAPRQQRLSGFAANRLACEGHGFYPLLVNGSQDITLGGSASGLSPGQAECIPPGPRGLGMPRLSIESYTAQHATVADLDGDTFPDLIAPDTVGVGFSILWGNPSFSATEVDEVCCDTRRVHSVAVGDFNKDGRLDLALTEIIRSQVMVMLARSDAARSFEAPTAWPVGNTPAGIATADANQDGFLDLIVANEASNTLSFLPGLPNGAFGAAQTLTPNGTQPETVLATHLDGDTRPDLVVMVSQGISITLDGSVQGPFGSSTRITTAFQPTAVAVGLLNGDTFQDLAVTHSGGVAIYLGSGTGTFTLHATIPVGQFHLGIAIGEFTGDAHVDLAVGDINGSMVTLLQGASNGNFTLHSRMPVTEPFGLATLDHNGDGLNDLAVLSPGNGQYGHSNLYILPGQRPVPTVSGSSFSFTAPAGAGFAQSIHGIHGSRRYWDYYTPLQPGPVSYALPLPSTLAPSTAPTTPSSGKLRLTWTPLVYKWESTSNRAFNPRQFSLGNLGMDSDTQPGASHYLWP